MSHPTARADRLDTIAIKVKRLKLNSPAAVLDFRPFELQLSQQLPVAKVIGPSGSGKTTFFKALIDRFAREWSQVCRVERDITVEVNGLTLADGNCEVGMAPQRPYLLANASVLDNLVTPFRWKNLPLPSQQRLEEVLTDFMLKPLQERPAWQLSAGERQRLNMARMFLAEPELAIIDEGIAALDEEAAATLTKVLAEKYCTSNRLLITSEASGLKPTSRYRRQTKRYRLAVRAYRR
jgi:ABC-type lipoprotein export system ATPase subunit